jgi:hypothetical protein
VACKPDASVLATGAGVRDFANYVAGKLVSGNEEEMRYSGKFRKMMGHVVEDDHAAFVRYCFEDLDAEIFRARFEPKIEQVKLAG